MFKSVLAAAVAVAGFGLIPRASAEPPGEVVARKQASFRLLVIVKTETRVPPAGMVYAGGRNGVAGSRPELGGGECKLGKDDLDRIRANLRTAAELVGEWGEGRVRWELTVRESPRPLTTVQVHDFTGFGDKPDGVDFAPAVEDVAEDLNEYLSPGEYDSVFVIWPWDGKAVPRANGYAHLPASLKMGFATIPYKQADRTRWHTRDGGTPGDIVHEWLHHLERFYGADPDLPGDMPCPFPAGPWRAPPLGVHEYQRPGLGYGHAKAEQFYRDFLTGELRNQATKARVPGGLGGHVPAFPTVRDFVRGGDTNLLWNSGTNRPGGDPRWVDAWNLSHADEAGEGVGGFLEIPDEYGNHAAANFETPNALRFTRTVKLKAGTSYVLSGRARVEGLTAAAGAGAGLTLFVAGPDGTEVTAGGPLTVAVPGKDGLAVPEERVTLEGTTGWVLVRRRVTVPKDGEYTVGVRVGTDQRPVTGAFGFGDLSLVEALKLARRKTAADVAFEPK